MTGPCSNGRQVKIALFKNRFLINGSMILSLDYFRGGKLKLIGGKIFVLSIAFDLMKF